MRKTGISTIIIVHYPFIGRLSKIGLYNGDLSFKYNATKKLKTNVMLWIIEVNNNGQPKLCPEDVKEPTKDLYKLVHGT